MRLAGALLGAAVLATVAVPAAAQEKQGPNCFFLTQWDGWTAQDAHTINLRIRPQQVWQLSLYSDCPSILSTSDGIGVTSAGETGVICHAADLNPIIVREQHLTQQCQVRSIRRLTADEVAALPPKARPPR